MKIWTFGKLQQEALKYKTRIEFQKNNPSAYTIACRENFIDRICSHMQIFRKKRTNEELAQIALKYKNKGEFQKKDITIYNIASRRKILDRICSHMQILRKDWTNDQLHKEALRYNTRDEFAKKSKAYHVAHKRNILKKICSHMNESKTAPWCYEEIKKEALKYKTRGEFQKNSNAYQIAIKRGIIDKICSHMKLSNNISILEKELFDTIRVVYPKAQKLIDRKVKIEGKPHIKGFDIDIYIPEFRKGIEFDGKYWHSFKIMRKNKYKKNWPEQDILNYHQIKDDWFKNKGIEILHIKEEDWLKNKEVCVDKCFKFLKNS